MYWKGIFISFKYIVDKTEKQWMMPENMIPSCLNVIVTSAFSNLLPFVWLFAILH